MTGGVTRTSVVLYVCTHRRNEELRRLLWSLRGAAATASELTSFGVVIVDDNPDGRAKEVADAHDGAFELGVHYVHSGEQNISVARNLGLERALPLAEWVAMVDDDVVVRDDWLVEHLALQVRTGADATTGPLLLTFPEGPAWISEEPFDQIGLHHAGEDELVGECQTGNSMIRSSFLAEHRHIRFDPDLGVVGGEDMVFYDAAIRAGLVAAYSRRVAVEEPEPAERSTLRYQLSRARWMGNTACVVNLRTGQATRARLLGRGARRVATGVLRPVRRLLGGERPQLRYGLALVSEGFGMLAGVAGLRLAHR